jgi:hypothetical protein
VARQRARIRSMTDEWRRISAVFEQALTLDADGRDRLLA